MNGGGAQLQRILLIQLHHLGDVVLTTPAIRAARYAFPSARIDFLTSRLGAQALEANPNIDRLLVAPTLRGIHRAKYDAVVDMHSVPRTALYAAATRAPVRIGVRGRGPRNLAYTHLQPREPNAVYMALQKLRLLEPLGIDTASEDLSLEIAIGPEPRAWARTLIEQHGLAKPIVAVSPVAKHQFKQWGADRWAVVADALAENGASIIVTSGPGELEQAEAVVTSMKHEAVWRYGPTTIRQLTALYEQCALWLGNDGGPKHIAAAAGTPTVTIYRKQHGGVWSDGSEKQIAINSGDESLDGVTPDAVIAAALRQLSPR